jgi:hypothetical protein
LCPWLCPCRLRADPPDLAGSIAVQPAIIGAHPPVSTTINGGPLSATAAAGGAIAVVERKQVADADAPLSLLMPLVRCLCLSAWLPLSVPAWEAELVNPHVLDDPKACLAVNATLRRLNELNETFTGKIMLLRRGTCAFGQLSVRLQRAGSLTLLGTPLLIRPRALFCSVPSLCVQV